MSDGAEDARAGPDEAAADPSARAAEVARLVSYVVLLAAAAGLYVTADALPTSQWEPLGAGAFPKLVMALLAGLCAIAAAGSLRRLARTGPPGRGAALLRDWVRLHRLVLWMFLFLAIYLILMRPLGFALATFLFLLAAQVTIAPKRRAALIAAPVLALVFSFGLDWVFGEVFNVFLPPGPFG